jgi:uncharacterized protein YkwD
VPGQLPFDFDPSELNWLDWALLLLLLLSALGGIQRGFLLGAWDLFAAAVALGAAFYLERDVADIVLRAVPSLPVAVVHVGAFLALLVIVQMAIDALLGRRMWAVARAIAIGPLAGLNGLLGAAPGLIRGALIVTTLLLALVLVQFQPQLVGESKIASRLTDAALDVLPAVQARLGLDLEAGLPSLVVAPPEPTGAERRPLPVGVIGDRQPDPTAEQRMLELVNAERARAGIRPLQADDRLREVARAHSLDMFEQNYFSHTSPTTGSPFDRIRRAAIPFLLAGENLAYAPNVEIAHQGLMNSPGHRANILRAEFGRVGIGIIRSQAQGSMFTQNFTN